MKKCDPTNTYHMPLKIIIMPHITLFTTNYYVYDMQFAYHND